MYPSFWALPDRRDQRAQLVHEMVHEMVAPLAQCLLDLGNGIHVTNSHAQATTERTVDWIANALFCLHENRAPKS